MAVGADDDPAELSVAAKVSGHVVGFPRALVHSDALTGEDVPVVLDSLGRWRHVPQEPTACEQERNEQH